jgi:hypothetical protein
MCRGMRRWNRKQIRVFDIPVQFAVISVNKSIGSTPISHKRSWDGAEFLLLQLFGGREKASRRNEKRKSVNRSYATKQSLISSVFNSTCLDGSLAWCMSHGSESYEYEIISNATSHFLSAALFLVSLAVFKGKSCATA